MLPAGHIAAGYLAGKLATVVVPSLATPKFLFLTIIFAFLPDLDRLLAFAKIGKFTDSQDVNHRTFATHAPIFYLGIFCVWLVVFPTYQMQAWSFIIGTMSHFAIDTLGADGILWLFPFSEKMYKLTRDNKIIIDEDKFFIYWIGFFRKYVKLPSFKLEIVLVLISLLILFLT